MAPVLRQRGEVEDANPARGRHLPVRVIRHSMSGSEREEEPRLNPGRIAMGPASEMIRRALREHEQQQAVRGEEDVRGGGQERERDDQVRDRDGVRRRSRSGRDRERDQDGERERRSKVQVTQKTGREASLPGTCTSSSGWT